tara:strand:+ start:3612 stop:5324 length:1713 start_codon:yes stop_codon:yes gene_type:complete
MAIKKVIEVDVEVNVDDAVKSVNELNKEIEKVGESGEKSNKKIDESVKGVGDSSKDAKKGLTGVATGFKGIGIAMKAAGIGLIIGLFVALKDIVGKNQKVMDFFSSVMTTIGLVFNAVGTAISDAYDSVSNVTGGFDAVKKVAVGLMNIALSPLKLIFYGLKAAVLSLQLGWEKSFLGKGRPEKIKELKDALLEVNKDIIEVKKGVVESGKIISNNFREAATELTTFGKALVDGVSKISVKALKEQADTIVALKNQAQIASAINRGLIEEYDRQAEQQRQIRDDVNKSIGERIAANNKLGEVLKEQEKSMLKNADLVIKAAENELLLNDNIENQVALIDARNEKLGILAQIEGFKSEQLVNETGLINEKAEAEKAASDAKIKASEDETASLKKARDIKAKEEKKAKDNEVKLAIQLRNQKLAIANNVAAGIIAIAGKSSVLGKSLAVAQAIWNTKQGVTNALANVPAPWNIAQAIATGLFGLAQVRDIIATPNPAGGGGAGVSVPSASAITAPAVALAPSFNVVGTSDSNQLAQSVSSQVQQPIQAFVVSTEVTTQQALDRNKQSTASFG